MKLNLIVKHIGSPDTWEEACEVPRDGCTAQAVIDNFNATLRKGEVSRELVSWCYASIDERKSFELFLTGRNQSVILPVHKITEYFAPTDELLTFLNEGELGGMFDLEDQADCHFSYAVLVIPGQGERLGIQDDTDDQPDIDPEDCSKCGADSDCMEWKADQHCWVCQECNAPQ